MGCEHLLSVVVSFCKRGASVGCVLLVEIVRRIWEYSACGSCGFEWLSACSCMVLGPVFFINGTNFFLLNETEETLSVS